MSCPLALVRAVVDLQMSGPTVTKRSWELLRRRLLGQPPDTDQYPDVEFPVRIGEYMQLNDGVVGYWLESAGRYLSHYAFTPDNLEQIKKAEQFQALTSAQREKGVLVNQSWFGAEAFLAELQAMLEEFGIVLGPTTSLHNSGHCSWT